MTEDRTRKLKIEKVVFGGDGLGRLEGKACFVPDVLTGETVEVVLTADKKNYSRGEAVAIPEPSASRIKPECRYSSLCGGCQYQHMDYEEEVRVKESQLVEMLVDSFGLGRDVFCGLHPSPDFNGYRHSVTLHAAKSSSGKMRRLGYIARDGVSHVGVDECLIAHPKLQPVFKKEVRPGKGAMRYTFKVSEFGEVAEAEKSAVYSVPILGKKVHASAAGFFQANLPVAEEMVRCVRDWVLPYKAEVFFDLYAGAGLFSIFCAEAVQKIICVESDKNNHKLLNLNLADKSQHNYKLINGLVERRFTKVYEQYKDKDCVVFIDPPRKGLDKRVAAMLREIDPPKALIYVSCDPSTLARDLKIILADGRYRIKAIKGFDMFPRTKHIETAVLLEGAVA